MRPNSLTVAGSPSTADTGSLAPALQREGIRIRRVAGAATSAASEVAPLLRRRLQVLGLMATTGDGVAVLFR